MSNEIISKLLKISDKNIEFGDNIRSEKIKDITYTVVPAKLSYTPEACPHCGSVNHNHSIVKNGTQISKILLNKTNNYPTILKLSKQRFYCKECGRTFVAETNLINRNCYISKDVKLSVVQYALHFMPMKSIAHFHAVSSHTVARVINEFAPKFGAEELPTAISVDEFKSTKNVDGAMSANITDPVTGRIIQVLPDRKKSTLEKYFNSFAKEQLNNVTLFTTDMYAPYIELAEHLFPNAQIVLDRFHIVQLFTRNMNKARIDLMNSYPTNSHRYRVLKRYWKLFLAKDWELNSLFYKKYFCYHKFTTTKAIKDDMLTFSHELKAASDFYQRLLEVMQDKDIQGMEKLIDTSIEDGML